MSIGPPPTSIEPPRISVRADTAVIVVPAPSVTHSFLPSGVIATCPGWTLGALAGHGAAAGPPTVDARARPGAPTAAPSAAGPAVAAPDTAARFTNARLVRRPP